MVVMASMDLSSTTICSAEGLALGSCDQHRRINRHKGSGQSSIGGLGRVQPRNATCRAMARGPMLIQGLVPEHISQITTPRE